MCVCVCVFVCVYLSLSIYLSIYTYIYMHLYTHILHTYTYISLSIHIYIYIYKLWGVVRDIPPPLCDRCEQYIYIYIYMYTPLHRYKQCMYVCMYGCACICMYEQHYSWCVCIASMDVCLFCDALTEDIHWSNLPVSNFPMCNVPRSRSSTWQSGGKPIEEFKLQKLQQLCHSVADTLFCLLAKGPPHWTSPDKQF